eukprot:441395_1
MAMVESDEKVVVNADDQHFIWHVDGDLLQQFKCAKSYQFFESLIYETLDGVKWKLKCHPNSESGRVALSVNLHSLPRDKQYVAANVIVITAGSDGSFHKRIYGGLNAETSILSQSFKTNISIKSLEHIKFEVNFDLAIYYQPEIKSGIWKINNNFLDVLRAANMNDFVVSPVFEQNGTIFYMRLYPNGYGQPGYAALDLVCPNMSTVESKRKELMISYKVWSPELDFCLYRNDIRIFSPDSKRRFDENLRVFRTDKFQNLQHLTFQCSMWNSKHIWKINKNNRLITDDNSSHFVMYGLLWTLNMNDDDGIALNVTLPPSLEHITVRRVIGCLDQRDENVITYCADEEVINPAINLGLDFSAMNKICVTCSIDMLSMKIKNNRSTTEKNENDNEEKFDAKQYVTAVIKSGPIVVISKSYCPYCKEILSILQKYSKNIIKKDIVLDFEESN